MVDRVPVMIAVNQYAIEGVAQIGQYLQTDPFFDRHMRVVREFVVEVAVKARINDSESDGGNRGQQFCGTTQARANFAHTGRSPFRQERHNKALREVLHLASS